MRRYIGYCLKKRNFFIENVKNGKGFQGAPNVIVTHPWWNNSKRDIGDFINGQQEIVP